VRFTNRQETYPFTPDSLYLADAVLDNDPIVTEADLVAELQDIKLERDYALSLSKARTRQDILDNIASRYSAATPMPPALALLFRKIRYTYKLHSSRSGWLLQWLTWVCH
jgi:hypothetical protein